MISQRHEKKSLSERLQRIEEMLAEAQARRAAFPEDFWRSMGGAERVFGAKTLHNVWKLRNALAERWEDREVISLPWLKAGETVWMDLDDGSRLRLYAAEDFQITEIAIQERARL